MKRILIKLFQWVISLLCWLTISPIFYYLTDKWKLIGKKFRIGLLAISPMFLILYSIICFWGLDFYFGYQRKHRFDDKETLERITGVTYPDFKVIEYTKDSETSFLGDYNDRLLIEFKELPSATFYQYLDSLIATGDSDWSIVDDAYSYRKSWGNGLPAPNGEDDKEDMMFSISLSKGSRQATINYGVW